MSVRFTTPSEHPTTVNIELEKGPAVEAVEGGWAGGQIVVRTTRRGGLEEGGLGDMSETRVSNLPKPVPC